MAEINLLPWRKLSLRHQRHLMVVKIVSGLILGMVSALGLRLLLLELIARNQLTIITLQKQRDMLQQQLPKSTPNAAPENNIINLASIGSAQQQLITQLQSIAETLPRATYLTAVHFKHHKWHILGGTTNLNLLWQYAANLEKRLNSVVLSKIITKNQQTYFTFNTMRYDYENIT